MKGLVKGQFHTNVGLEIFLKSPSKRHNFYRIVPMKSFWRKTFGILLQKTTYRPVSPSFYDSLPALNLFSFNFDDTSEILLQ